jgi:hypothetical protein
MMPNYQAVARGGGGGFHGGGGGFHGGSAEEVSGAVGLAASAAVGLAASAAAGLAASAAVDLVVRRIPRGLRTFRRWSTRT